MVELHHPLTEGSDPGEVEVPTGLSLPRDVLALSAVSEKNASRDSYERFHTVIQG